MRAGDDLQIGDVDLFYSHYYEAALNQGVIGRAQRKTHKDMERLWTRNRHFDRVLEVGAGNGEHRSFVRHSYKTYIQTDIRYNPILDDQPSCSAQLDGDRLVTSAYADAQALPFKDFHFDRLIATCLLLHLPEPEAALREWRRVVRPDGWITILIPCEPGLLLRLSRAFLTSRKVKRLGYTGYALFNARDHRNHISGLRHQVRYVFRNDQVREARYPLRIRSWNLNVYYIYQIRKTARE